MDLNDLLADIDGLGGDTFVPSTGAQADLPAPASMAPAAPPADVLDALSVEHVLGDAPAPPVPAFGSLDMVLDVELEVEVELGRTRLPLKHVLTLGAGDVLALDRRQEDPVKIFVNDRLVAYGDALIVDGALAVKVVEFLAAEAAG